MLHETDNSASLIFSDTSGLPTVFKRAVRADNEKEFLASLAAVPCVDVMFQRDGPLGRTDNMHFLTLCSTAHVTHTEQEPG